MGSWLERYAEAFARIPGWFTLDAALLFMMYNSALDCRRDVLEIGAFHGLSAICIAALRGADSKYWIIEPFGFPGYTKPRVEESFWNNLDEFGVPRTCVHLERNLSQNVSAAALGGTFTFCHIDGGHLRDEVYADLELCATVLQPDGLLALDDYMNPKFPGVIEGMEMFMRNHPRTLKPVSIGFNKLLLQRTPVRCDVQARVRKHYPEMPSQLVPMWNQEAVLYTEGLVHWFDLAKSAPDHLIRAEADTVRGASGGVLGQVKPRTAGLERWRRPRGLSARIQPAQTYVQLPPSGEIRIPVRLTNRSPIAFLPGPFVPIQLSYHLLDVQGRIVRFDNGRSFLVKRIEPAETGEVSLRVVAPETAGHYQLEVDLVWEGVTWFKDWGSRTALIQMTVT